VAQAVPGTAAALGSPTIAKVGATRPPAGPTPADSTLPSVVYARIREDRKVEQQGFTVSIKDGIVGLTGRVDNLLSRDRATRLAEAVRGVRAVDNRMEIVPEKRDDADIESDLLKALLYNAATAKMPIHAEVRNGVARLTGTVNSWQEQELAERIADDVRGVRFTQNDLATKRTPIRLDSLIASDIKTRFVWDVLIENDPVMAVVKDANVALSGRVGSAAEKRRAITDAYVDGVHSVDGRGLLVEPDGAFDQHWQPALTKSDADIALAIRDAESYDPRVQAANIAVAVASGVATLSGTVDTLNAKLVAAAVARSTVGVTDVNNQIVARSQQDMADTVLAGRIHDTLSLDPLIDVHQISITSENDYVTLTGIVGTGLERAEAFDVASRMAGVVGVANRLETQDQVVPHFYSALSDPALPFAEAEGGRPYGAKLTDEELARRITSELRWSPFVRADEVQVRVENGKATLSGTVHQRRARQAAAKCAFEGGAASVDNRIIVF
jgi:osmotically-inducible protein OsmY